MGAAEAAAVWLASTVPTFKAQLMSRCGRPTARQGHCTVNSERLPCFAAEHPAPKRSKLPLLD